MAEKLGLARIFAFPAKSPLLDTLKQKVFDKVPPLKAVMEAGSVRDYLAPLRDWKPDTRLFPYAERNRVVIADHVRFYFGEDAARETVAQLERTSCVETGTHMSFPRDRDYYTRDVTVDNTMVWQGALLSAMSYQEADMKYHMGAYSGTISVDNTNGPLYLQLGREKFMVSLLTKKNRKSFAGLTPALTDEEIDAVSLEVSKQIYAERLTELQDILSDISHDGDQKVAAWHAFVHSGKGYSPKNDKTLFFIQNALSEEYGIHDFYDYHDDIRRIETISRLMKDVVHRAKEENRSVNFADQVIVAQKYLMDEIMPVGIEQISWNFSQVSKQLMIEAFRDPQSVFHQIFAQPELRDTFVERLGNIRVGWAYNGPDDCEAPFWLVQESKGSYKTSKVSYAAIRDDLTPENIAQALESGKAIPTLGLEVLFCITECGMAFNGGMFQCQYAPQYANGMASILDDMGLNERAAAIRSMPLHIATQSLAFGALADNGTLRLARYSDLLDGERISAEQAARFLDMPAETALTLAAPSLACFLDGGEEPDPELQKAAFEYAGFRVDQAVNNPEPFGRPRDYSHKL